MMRKLALIFVLAVLAPSLILAALAFRSLRHQELVAESQRALLYEAAAQSVVKDIIDFFAEEQRGFSRSIENFLGKEDPFKVAENFDPLALKIYPHAEVGFAVSLNGKMYSPSLLGRPEARRFRLANERFLTSRETAEVYWNGPKGPINLSLLDQPDAVAAPKSGGKAVSASRQFRELIGSQREGVVARFTEDRLRLLLWHRSAREDQIILGVEVRPERLVPRLAELLRVEEGLRTQIALALLNEASDPVATSPADFRPQARPLESVEIGDYLPHWKVAVYSLPNAAPSIGSQQLRILFSLLIALLLLAIGVGGWLIFHDTSRELRLARQRSGFVSNVSHELKTPLTSIRMFSELLAEQRVDDSAKQREYLNIITSETARLTRLINNVLDFARLERGEKRYSSGPSDLNEVAARTLAGYRPHLEQAGFQVELTPSPEPLVTAADPDAIAQILLNLLSNAEKYSPEAREVHVQAARTGAIGQVSVLDRGRGVPKGLEERVFEQFYRAHDALNEGIQGAGLGLTLARQIARGYRGDVTYSPREGGGSIFTLTLPLIDAASASGKPRNSSARPANESSARNQ